MTRRTIFLALAVALAFTAGMPRANADLTLVTNPGFTLLRTTARTVENGEQVFDEAGITIPFLRSRTLTSGLSSATTDYDFSVAGGVNTFEFGVTHVRGGGESGNTDSAGNLFFTVTEDSFYSFSGAYSMSGINLLHLGVQLRDTADLSTSLFLNFQQSRHTADQSFVLGEQAGDTGNNLSGFLSGNLLAGHTYVMNYGFFLNDSDNLRIGASASGFLTFEVGAGVNPNPVIPAPGAVVLGALGLGMVGWLKRRVT